MIVEVLYNSPYLKQVLQIYNEAFKEDEREPDDTVLKRLEQQRYKLYAYVVDDTVQGFYMVDYHPTLDYAILTFLAVAKELRNRKIGSRLCKDAIERFLEEGAKKALFIEAKEGVSKLYQNLGFKKLPFGYQVPNYGKKTTTKMDLLCIAKEGTILKKKFLTDVIVSNFVEGYLVDPNDKRIKKQIEKIPQEGVQC